MCGVHVCVACVLCCMCVLCSMYVWWCACVCGVHVCVVCMCVLCACVCMCVLDMIFIRLFVSYHSAHATSLQDSPHIAELISVVTLIRNLLYKSFDSKVCCAFASQRYGSQLFVCLFANLMQTTALSSHLPTAVQKIWPWCCTCRRLLVSVLQLLCVFCAQHSPGLENGRGWVSGGEGCLRWRRSKGREE